MEFLAPIVFLALLAGPVFLIDRSATPSHRTKAFWWTATAASGVAGLLLPVIIQYLVSPSSEYHGSIAVSASLIGLALPWVVYLLYRKNSSRNSPMSSLPQVTPPAAPTETPAQISKGFRIARTLAIVAALLVLVPVAIVVFVMACCSR